MCSENRIESIRINTLFIVILLSIVSSCSPVNKEKANEVEKLKVITYNVWYGFTKVPERKTMWIKWLQDQQPDIVALQELNTYTSDQLAKDAKSYGHSYSVLLKEEGFPTGITSCYPIEDVKRMIDGFHHGLMRVKIKGIYFYVIHLHPSNWEVRIRETDQILEDIKTLPTDSKVILAGDLNTFSPDDSMYYKHGRLEPFFNERDIEYNEKNLNAGKLDYSVIQKFIDAGFTDLEVKTRSGDYKFTGSFPTLIQKEGEHGDQRRLDYIFVSANMINKSIRARIIASDTTKIMSDHLPVAAFFSPWK